MNIVGARPNFVKIAPIVRTLRKFDDVVTQKLVHTGQHYDDRLSTIFFEELKVPAPDVNLGIGSGTHAQQTAAVMVGIEPLLREFEPTLVLVVGDVNSTLAAALTAKKNGIRVAHVEAGLRSFDMAMPEEINRLCTDAIADDLFTTDKIADLNLLREGAAPEQIHFVGNVMIDSLDACREFAAKARYHERLDLRPKQYATLTMHRPANVDDPDAFSEILEALCDSVGDLPIIFPIHPRSRQRVNDFGLDRYFTSKPKGRGIWMTAPLSYIEFLSLNNDARIVLTDSGGVQEETTVLGVPCVTLRENTERPITVIEGTNRLGGTSRETIVNAVHDALSDGQSNGRRPERWDGHAADRIVGTILNS
jgi:UDP-N-acetylglucosamine 2-epimerase (non-hydrolysing)